MPKKEKKEGEDHKFQNIYKWIFKRFMTNWFQKVRSLEYTQCVFVRNTEVTLNCVCFHDPRVRSRIRHVVIMTKLVTVIIYFV